MREANFERLWRSYNLLRSTPRFAGHTLLTPEPRGFNFVFFGALLRMVLASSRLAKAAAAEMLEAGAPTGPAQRRVVGCDACVRSLVMRGWSGVRY